MVQPKDNFLNDRRQILEVRAADVDLPLEGLILRCQRAAVLGDGSDDEREHEDVLMELRVRVVGLLFERRIDEGGREGSEGGCIVVHDDGGAAVAAG